MLIAKGCVDTCCFNYMCCLKHTQVLSFLAQSNMTPFLWVSNALAAFFLNISTFLLISTTSALTLNVSGVIKVYQGSESCAFFPYSFVTTQHTTCFITNHISPPRPSLQDWMLIGMSSVAYSDPVSLVSLAGYFISFMGVFYYNYKRIGSAVCCTGQHNSNSICTCQTLSPQQQPAQKTPTKSLALKQVAPQSSPTQETALLAKQTGACNV